MRMHAQTAMIENGFVHLPNELTVFPKGKHDDQVDSTAEMLDWFKRGGQEPQDWPWQLYNWNAGLPSFPRKRESSGFK